MEAHRESLGSLCRICTMKLGRVSYPCDYMYTEPGKGSDKAALIEVFLCTSSDDPDIHPSCYCMNCQLTLIRMRKAREDGKVYRTSMTVSPHTWEAHQEVGCTTCAMVRSRKPGGRPKKKRNILGCPSYLTDHLHQVAGPRHTCSVLLTRERFLPVSLGGVSIDDLVCRVCKHILDEPIELPCKHCLCCGCCIGLLTSNLLSISCPTCKGKHEITVTSFTVPSPLTVKLLQQLVVHCEKEGCSKAVHLCDLRAHLASNCRENSDVRHSITLGDILEQPTSAPPTRVEMEAAGHVVRRTMLSQSQGQAHFSLPTGGCVSSRVLHVDSILFVLLTATHTHKSDKVHGQLFRCQQKDTSAPQR